MLRRVALVRTGVSEERIAYIIRVTRIGGLGTTLAVTINRSTLRSDTFLRIVGGDYEECRLMGYKNPVRTPQGRNYVSATESSWLMLCKIWGFHSGDCGECRLQACYAVWLLQLLFTANVPSSLTLSSLMMEAMHSSETLLLTRGTRRHIPEYGILSHSGPQHSRHWRSSENSIENCAKFDRRLE
jgi:hypothetical protein